MAKDTSGVAFRDGLVWKVVHGFEDHAAGVRWLGFAGVDNFHALVDQKSGRPSPLEVVTLAEINKRKGLSNTWAESEKQRAAEIAEQEAAAKAAAEERERREAEAAKEAAIRALVAEKFKADQLAKLARWRKQAEEELAKQGQS